MKALTVHNPYAHLLVTPQDELPDGAVHKRCENRTWPAPFRGKFAIHAGVSLDWFRHGDWPDVPDGKLKPEHFPCMAFGAIVAVAEIVDCVYLENVLIRNCPQHLEWLTRHHHATGPYCFIVDKVVRLPDPVPAVGQQKFWTVPKHIEESVMSQVGGVNLCDPYYCCG